MQGRSKKLIAIGVAASGALTALGASAMAAPITPGDLVVYQVGTGSGTLSGTSAAGFVDEFTTAGASVQQIAMPTAAGSGNNAFSTSGSATSEGGLEVSPNSQYVTIPGYDAAPGTASIAGTTATNDPREVAIIPVSTGVVNTSTTLGSTAFSGNNPRSAVTTDGTNIWVGGAGGSEATQGGVWYTTAGSTTSTILVGGNQRIAEVYNNQLYLSSASGTAPAVIGISAVGSGLPTTSGQTTSLITGVDSSSSGTPYSYVMESLGGTNNPDTIYVADTTLGIEKYSLEGSTWTLTGTVSITTGITGLAALDVDGTVDLYATSPTSIYSVADASGFEGTLSGSATVIDTAGTGEAFRGIGIVAPVPEPATMGLLAISAVSLLSRRRRA